MCECECGRKLELFNSCARRCSLYYLIICSHTLSQIIPVRPRARRKACGSHPMQLFALYRKWQMMPQRCKFACAVKRYISTLTIAHANALMHTTMRACTSRCCCVLMLLQLCESACAVKRYTSTLIQLHARTIAHTSVRMHHEHAHMPTKSKISLSLCFALTQISHIQNLTHTITCTRALTPVHAKIPLLILPSPFLNLK